MRAITREIKELTILKKEELYAKAKSLNAPLALVSWVAEQGKLPVPHFSAGGVATPADAALLRQLGAESVFVGSGIFKSADPEKRASAIVKATTHFDNPDILLEVSSDLAEGMSGFSNLNLENLVTRKV